MNQFDFVIIGSGIAGLSLDLNVAQYGSVALVTKRSVGESSTAWAQGGVAAVTSAEDSFDLHLKDTLSAGAGLCNEQVVRTIVTEGPAAIQDLIKWGVNFDERVLEDGHRELDLTREGGHSKRRVLHYHDTTGREIEQRLLAAVGATANVTVLPNHMAVDLITTGKLGFTTEDRVVGVYILDEEAGAVKWLRSDRVILATGGCGKVYLYTTNPNIATGDGIVMAWRAGAAIANMEFIQFHPTCLFHPEARSVLINEAVRGEGAVLRRPNGEPFMKRYDPRAELAPRDIVARAIDSEMKVHGFESVLLDISHKPADWVRERFPTVYERCLQFGFDLTTGPVPVVPAAHYVCGGVLTDIHARSSIGRLYAAGEVACTGLHGANRLASNSLLEGLVFGHRAATHLLEHRRTDARLPPTLRPWDPGRATDSN